MKYLLLFTSLIVLGTYPIKSQNLQEILQQVNTTTMSNGSIEYDYVYDGWGKTAGRFSGHVTLDKKQGMRLLVTLNTLDQNGSPTREEVIFTDGNQLKLLDKTENVLKTGSAGGGSAYLMSYVFYAVFREFLMPDPFAMAMSDSTLAYEGTRSVNGVDCHVIGTNNPWGDRNLWFIGKEDFQIHGQKQEKIDVATEGGFTFEMSNVRFNGQISSSAFDIDSGNAQIVDEDKRLVAVGQLAPEWLLKNAAGQNITSRQLRGKKVILDFWASWCAPCWQIMPTIDRLKKEYGGKKVEIYGVNVWENPKLDVNGYLLRKELNHYEVLFDVEASVAKSFKIAALPLVVLIDENGKILYLNNGRDASLYENLKELLD